MSYEALRDELMDEETTYRPKYMGACSVCFAPIFEGTRRIGQYGPHRGSNLRYLSNFICEKCSQELPSCSSCGFFFEKDHLVLGRCPSCVSVSAKRVIKNYTYKVDEEISLIGKPKDQIYYGVELELESKNYNYDSLVVSELIKGFACLKRDSSLEEGFEIVTAPCALEEHYKIWDGFINELPHTVYPLRTCGMHVHATRFRLSDLQIGKILCFLHNPSNGKFVKLIAGRPSNFHNDFTAPKKISDGLHGGLVPQNAERHTALNLNGDKTIEFRIFRSSKMPVEILKNIEFCRAMIKFTDWGVCSIQQAQQWKQFVNFVFSYKRDFPYLSNFLKLNINKL